MNTYEAKQSKSKSQSIASDLSDKVQNREAFQHSNHPAKSLNQESLQLLADNSLQNRKAESFQRMADENTKSSTFENNDLDSTIQRMVKVDLMVDDDSKKKIKSTGKVKDFKGGTSAGNFGWIGVESYRSRYKITDGTYVNEDGTDALQNSFTNPEAGHVLAKQNGGDGSDPWNVFAQDGGTNNSIYKVFENGMRNTLNLYDGDDDVEFVSYLAGTKIEESGNIRDAGLDPAMDISSEEDN